mmetsp:Transcript_15459/g.34877  ORF Transcript_15459/g.34877 Transcript_15459/m.34877 type:complete len:232 (+) Transcript_15459:1-696(+)
MRSAGTAGSATTPFGTASRIRPRLAKSAPSPRVPTLQQPRCLLLRGPLRWHLGQRMSRRSRSSQCQMPLGPSHRSSRRRRSCSSAPVRRRRCRLSPVSARSRLSAMLSRRRPRWRPRARWPSSAPARWCCTRWLTQHLAASWPQRLLGVACPASTHWSRFSWPWSGALACAEKASRGAQTATGRRATMVWTGSTTACRRGLFLPPRIAAVPTLMAWSVQRCAASRTPRCSR